jgi:putative redox protein
MAVEIDLTYEGQLTCSAIHGPSGKALSTDAPVDNGGRGSTFSPTDLVATALGACMLTIIGLVAKRDSIAVEGAKVHVVKEMVADPVRRIGKLAVRITMPAGVPYSEADRAKLRRAADTCPVKQSLHPETVVETEFVFPD